jgi:hypothetical protein
MTDSDLRPIVLITGATGHLGHSLGETLGGDYGIFEILIGGPDAIGYDALHGELIHGLDDWPTPRVLKPRAAC